jgi:hypothetical protein
MIYCVFERPHLLYRQIHTQTWKYMGSVYEKMNGLIEVCGGAQRMVLIGFSKILISTCPVCLIPKLHVFHLRPCGHTLCKKCMFEIYFKTTTTKRQNLCPICRESSIPQLPDNYYHD